jgi:hypothetical protein
MKLIQENCWIEYDKNCNIDKCRKRGYDYMKYIGVNDEVWVIYGM